MSLTKITSTVIADSAITPAKISNDVSLGIKIANVSIANSTYDILDDTAISTDGGYIVITGSGFASGAQVLIEGTAANSTSFVSDSELRAQVPAKSAGSYNVYVINSDGATGIRVNGLTYSANPAWVTGGTLDNQTVDVAFSVALDATDAVSYANSTALPAGTTLLSNGYFYGTVTGITEETTYTFTVVATDAENQDSPRTFSVTVTTGPVYTLYSWGTNTDGTLGLNDVLSRSSPTQVSYTTDWAKVDYYGVAAAIKQDGTLWTWGSNSYGMLGLGDIVNRSSPTQVGSGTYWKEIASGGTFTIAVRTNGTLWIWGAESNDYYGVLGQNSRGSGSRSSPIQVGSLTDWNIVSAGIRAWSALKNNGTLWRCGWNPFGNLGIGTKDDSRSSPIQIGSSTWSKISNTYGFAAAIKSDNTLWLSGYNVYGNLGINNRTAEILSLTQIAGSWSNVSVSAWNSLGIKTDGTLWSWGNNNHGQLGLGNTIYRSSPVQIGSDTNWSKISTKGGTSFAIKTNGTLWGWGDNTNGQVGTNTVIKISSPVQIGTADTWTDVVGGGFALAIQTT